MAAQRPSNELKNKTNIHPVNNRLTEATAEDFNEIGAILNDHADILDNVPQSIEIAQNLIIPSTHNGWTYLAKANVTIILNENLHSGFQAQCITMGGVITLQAGAGCQLRKADGTLTEAISLQDEKTLAITRFANNIFHVTGEID